MLENSSGRAPDSIWAGMSLTTETSFSNVAGDLKPTTTKAITMGRYYGQTTLVEPLNMAIEPTLFSNIEAMPQYLPPKWIVHVQPEGQRYFFKEADIRIVTMDNVYDSKVLEKIDYWTKKVMDILEKQVFALSDDVELFLQIDGNDCAYYFVNHRTHIEFWLDSDLSTDKLGIDPVVSASHLKLALHELYWFHIELFPVHLQSFAPHVLEELLGCYSQGWAVQQRFRTHYGEQVAQLSRDQSILVDRYDYNTRESRIVSILTFLLTFKTSNDYASRLNALHVDWISYEYDWQSFMKKCLKDWKHASYMAHYLGAVRSKNFEFQWVAFVYALPKTFLFWGIAGFVYNCLFGVAVLCGGGTLTSTAWIYYFCGMTSLCLLATIAFQDVTSEKKVLRLPSFRWRRGSEEGSVALAV
ncbi:hypothetical protein C0995_003491 [Termitomyces sp. Mi166|nr:hypothetical protein C0995_003491 [Termitomyces sp. Mi166\